MSTEMCVCMHRYMHIWIVIKDIQYEKRMKYYYEIFRIKSSFEWLFLVIRFRV